MPLYEYECTGCGTFECFRSITHASRPCECPSCSRPADRVWSVPRVRTMSANNLKAAERNEKSRHAPHLCRKGCGCSSKSRPMRGKNQKPVQPGQKKLQAYDGCTRSP